MPETFSLTIPMKADDKKENYRTILLLILFTVTIHMAFNIWYISISPEIINDPMNRLLDNETSVELPISKIASYTIGEYTDFGHAPFFGLYEFIIYSISGYEKPNLILSVVLIKAILGTILLYLVVLRLLGKKAALGASILHAIYFDYLIFPSLRASYSNFNLVYVLAMVYLFLDYYDNGYSRKNLFLHFIVCGLALNTDSKLLFFPALEVIALFILQKNIAYFSLLRMLFVCYMGFVVILIPFLIRNYVYLGELRPTQGGLSSAISSGLGRHHNPYFPNRDWPFIYTNEEVERRGLRYTHEYEEEVLKPELRRRLKEVLLHDKALFFKHFSYNFIRLTLPWTMNDPEIKGKLLKAFSTEPVEQVRTRSLETFSWKKYTAYVGRELSFIIDITGDFIRLILKIEIYLIPYLLKYLYLAGVLILLKQKKLGELFIVSLPVIYSTFTLFWILTNPDYLMASYLTFFTTSAMTIKALLSYVGDRVPYSNQRLMVER